MMFEDDNARLIDPSAESAMNPNAKTNDNMYDVAPKCRVPITRRIRMTGNIAHFEAKTSWDPGYGDIVEIFRDDRPFWDEFTGAKTHFSFGTRKAKWILMFMDVIKDFYDSSGVLPGTQHSPKVISRDTVTLSWHPNFKKGRHTIEKPYLELSAKGGKMGFGLTKAEALILLHEDLKKFVRESA